MSLRPRGFPLVLAAPSGAGKTTLARALAERDPAVIISVSATTRRPRPDETPRRDYLFVDDAEFDRMQRAGELVEWAVVHGRRYGTPRGEIERGLAAGRVVVLDIDVQGARQVRGAFPETALVFVLPPSAGELVQRLRGRASETAEERAERLRTARTELAAAQEFDYVIVNDDFNAASRSLGAIVEAERRRVSRTDGLEDRLSALDKDLESDRSPPRRNRPGGMELKGANG